MRRLAVMVGCLVAGFGVPPGAETDVAAAAVGPWECKTEVRRPMTLRAERLLITKSLRPDGAQWKADAAAQCR